MHLNAHDNLVLVAPRPVRLSAPAPFSQFHSAVVHRPQPMTTVRFVSAPSDAFDRLKLGDETSVEDVRADLSSPSERDRSVSPRASPRSTLPSEAMEEFLSILQPSSFLFPPTSPILRPSNSTVHGFVPYRRPGSCTLSPVMHSDGLGMTIQSDCLGKENDLVTYPFKILGGHLSSPISRTHTRNPFPRQASFDNAMSAFISEHSTSPSPVSMALSPAAVPLPLPTPDEMELDPVS